LFSFLFSLTVGNKPKILVHPPDHVHAIKGQTMFLNCLTTGIPTPIDSWYYVGPVFSQHVKHSIRNNSKYAIYSNGTLVIRNLQTKDMGVYECKASNIIGSTSKQFKIYTPSKLSFRMKQIDFKCPWCGRSAVREHEPELFSSNTLEPRELDSRELRKASLTIWSHHPSIFLCLALTRIS